MITIYSIISRILFLMFLFNAKFSYSIDEWYYQAEKLYSSTYKEWLNASHDSQLATTMDWLMTAANKNILKRHYQQVVYVALLNSTEEQQFIQLAEKVRRCINHSNSDKSMLTTHIVAQCLKRENMVR
ncbi:MAG: hypothetical protein P857_629 [Candidatus Xenolissoclinum pacificiensis L6]|uniref:Uncharacterized protein n=1 Tax=Candidatus Xenolissoclinum pacificiensis L6 TaxID=1401685 RepID=W2V117_9RICK|nr:MAG: hypothetical protein P857_629 [Candidatus Xenolissoclinum pacificiensis L6]